ncbi:MAG: hypothetical protein PHD82_02435 [Candidatus Riflebacteria bacterium]|jgi:hypothetical protein|nr:hypothetical protein [Candidatus Riflebacteria bacterium]
MPFKIIRPIVLLALLLSLLSPVAADTDSRVRYMGTSIFTMPTGYTRSAASYINDSGHSAMMVSQEFMNKFFELSFLRHLNGSEKGKNPLSVKIKMLEEGAMLPSLVWGASDLNTQLGSKIFYFAASKSIEAFGVYLHGGFYKDPITTDRKYFYGFEKMVLPLITVGAERSNDIDTFGVKLSPYPGISLEIAQRDRKEELYNIIYFRSF